MLWVLLSMLVFGAVVNGPLFSLDASGAVGKAIVYTKWKGRNVVREYVTPANPRSIPQRGRRTWMALLNLIWQSMDTTDRESWADLAAAGNYSNFNGFTAYNLDRQTTNSPPTKNRTDTPTAISGLVDGVAAFPGTNRIDLQVDIATGQAGGYVVLALKKDSTGPGADELSAVVVLDGTTADAYFPAISDLPAGTYSISQFWVTNDGTIGSVQESANAIVVPGVF